MWYCKQVTCLVSRFKHINCTPNTHCNPTSHHIPPPPTHTQTVPHPPVDVDPCLCVSCGCSQPEPLCPLCWQAPLSLEHIDGPAVAPVGGGSHLVGPHSGDDHGWRDRWGGKRGEGSSTCVSLCDFVHRKLPSSGSEPEGEGGRGVPTCTS